MTHNAQNGKHRQELALLLKKLLQENKQLQKTLVRSIKKANILLARACELKDRKKTEELKKNIFKSQIM